MERKDYVVKYVRAFKDNYIWLLLNTDLNQCVAIDPGDPYPLLDFLDENHVELESIWITHHHSDHTGGIDILKNTFCIPVYGPKNELIYGVDIKLDENDILRPSFTNTNFKILNIPGHTKGHIAIYSSMDLFCGDTLFSAGCGRLFEGTAEQMYRSLQKIASLPDETFVFCAHEYTLNNLIFAKIVEPSNREIPIAIEEIKNKTGRNEPSLPTTIDKEKKINPFLRCHIKEIKINVETHFNKKLKNEIDVFHHLRMRKDNFKV